MRAEEGERIKVFIVPKEWHQPVDVLRTKLHDWVAERLQPLEQPRSFTFGTALPTNAMGKPSDWPIA